MFELSNLMVAAYLGIVVISSVAIFRFIFSPIGMEEKYIGMTIDDALKMALTDGYVCRIVRQDGKAVMLYMDHRSNRLNFVVEKGIVVGCKIY